MYGMHILSTRYFPPNVFQGEVYPTQKEEVGNKQRAHKTNHDAVVSEKAASASPHHTTLSPK